MGIKHAYRIRNTETKDKMQTEKFTRNEEIKSTELILQIYYHNMMLPPLSATSRIFYNFICNSDITFEFQRILVQSSFYDIWSTSIKLHFEFRLHKTH